MLVMLAMGLNDKIDKAPLRNLNISHNVLCQDESNEEEADNSS